MKSENVRSLNELKSIIENVFHLKYETYYNGDIILVIPKSEMNKWIYQVFIKVFNSLFLCPSLNVLPMFHTIKAHKNLVRFTRRMYNQFPIVFGYSVRNPLDKYDDEFGERIASERLIVKLQNPYWNQ